jgi:hypothetical protein
LLQDIQKDRAIFLKKENFLIKEQPMMLRIKLLFCLLALSGTLRAQQTPDTSSNWMSEMQHGIALREYHIQPDADGRLQSPNRANNLRFRYNPDGFSMETRQDSLGLETWSITLRLAGVFRGLDFCFGADPEARQDLQDNHLQFHHAGGLTMEYINGMAGMRQNFILHERPVGEGALKVRLDLDSELHAHLSSDKELVFGKSGQHATLEAKVRYKDLQVWDATGAVVPAWMELDGDALALVVDDACAIYPLTIDPLSTSPAAQLESNQANALVGYSVSSAGDVNGDGYSDVIVGAPFFDNGQADEGAAFVYHGSASGISTTLAALLEGDQAFAQVGYDVSSAGDVNGDGYGDVIVGAWQFDNGLDNEGAAFVYHGSATGISTTPATQLESNQEFAQMGVSVSSAGDVNGDGYSDVIVGAHFFDNGEVNEGVAFVYHGSASGISTNPAAGLENNQASSRMGSSVSSAGDVNGDGYSDVIVGARGFDNGESNEGAAFVYHGSVSGILTTPTAQLEINQANAALGNSVSSAGDVNGDGYSDVIVGAWQFTNGQTDEGAAFVYHGSAAGILSSAATQVESNQAAAEMGVGVSSAGDVNGDGYSDVIVGVYKFDNGQTDEGAAFVYHGSASGISTTPAVQLESNQASAEMGLSVSSAGDVNGDGYSDVIVGAYLFDNGQNNEGVAFVYHGSASGISTTTAAQVESNQAFARMGHSVSSAGDVNGDGYSDVIVGAHFFDNGQTDEGAAFVYHGSASGILTSPAAQVESNQAMAAMGHSVSSAGDVNGDGYSDVIVGAHLFDNGQTNEGVAFVYHGSPSGILTSPAALLEGNQAGAEMAGSVNSAGDVNGDGYSDVIVGAWRFTNGHTAEGAAFVYHGSASGISTALAAQVESNQAGAWMGISVNNAGDVNGDGYSDVIVGAYRFDNGQADEGVAFVYHGSASGISTTPAVQLESNQVSAEMGWSVSSAGDVNGDGYSDVIVGAYLFDNGQTDEGAAFVYHGSASGIATIPAAQVEINQANAWMGFGVSGAGDVNGDGYSDVIISSLYFDNGQTDEGAAFVYHGSASGISTALAAQVESNQANAEMGYSVSGAGDVNGDGYSDVIVGVWSFDNGQTNEGAAFVYHGNRNGNLYRNTRQYRSNLITPVVTGTGPGGNFGIGHFARSHYGRVKVKLVWEVFAEGDAFSGTPITHSVAFQGISANWTDIGTAGIEIKELLTGVGQYSKWRARLKYHPATPMDGQVYSRWFYGGIHDEAEMSIRIAGACIPTASAATVTACNSYTWPANSQTYTSGGVYSATLTNAQGCDSVLTLNLTVNASTTSAATVTACNSYTWPANSQTYTSSGVHTATLTNSQGCDSVLTLNLAVNASTTSATTVTACNSYTWPANGQTYTSSGVYTATLTNAQGCDSTVTLNLTLNASTTSATTMTACNSYTWPANGQTYTSSGVHTATLTNAQGCDSTVTLNLTLNASTTSAATMTACNSYTWPANGQTYTSSGVHTATLTNAQGCDSTVTLNLTIHPSPTVSLAPLPDTLCTTAGLQALNGSPSGGTYSGTSVTGSQFDPATAGVGMHTLTYSYTDGSNCTDADTMVVVVEVCTGLEHALFAQIKLYPNPNHGTFSISGLPPGCEIEVWSAWGQKLFAHVADETVLEVRLGGVSKGTYLVKIASNGQHILRKIVVQ